MKKKVLFVYRFNALNDILLDNGKTVGPTEFLWGMNYLDPSLYDITYVNAPRDERKTGIRRLFSVLEYPFRFFAKIGLPLEIYLLYKKEIDSADIIVCVNDQISLSLLFWKAVGFLKQKKMSCIVMSLQERIKYFRWNYPLVWFMGFLLRRADTLLTLSEYVQSDFVHDYHLNKKKVQTLYFGVDTEFWKPIEGIAKEDFILSIGNDMNRDFATLVTALPTGMHLKVITKKSVDTQGKNIEILSDLTNEEVREMYNKAKIVVIPSIAVKNESSGLSSATQAMACARPVIISGAQTMYELFEDGKECLYYEPENPEDLSSKIKLLADNTILRSQVAIRGYKKVCEIYTCKKMGEQLNYILSKL